MAFSHRKPLLRKMRVSTALSNSRAAKKKKKKPNKKLPSLPGHVAPSFLGGGDGEDHGSRPAWKRELVRFDLNKQAGCVGTYLSVIPAMPEA
jgi:hypothetical protein